MTYAFHIPALEIDARIANIGRGSRHGFGDVEHTPETAQAQLSRRQKTERRIAWNLIAHLERAGFAVHSVFDGDNDTRAPDAKAAMELIFNLDEVSVRFKPRDPRYASERYTHGVLLVLSNDTDIVSDWNYTEGDPDGFSAAMDAFNDLIDQHEGR